MFEALVTELQNVIPISPPRPGDSFAYDGVDYTALEFMKTKVGFSPENFVAMESTLETHELALRALVTALRNDVQVPLGLVIFKTSAESSQSNSSTSQQDEEKSFEAAGSFTEKLCEQSKCTKSSGGHEVIAVNFLEEEGKISGIIIKNSWGAVGRDVNGNVTEVSSEKGFFIVTSEYLSQHFNVNDPWDFILPKAIATLPEFGLLKKQE